MTLTDQSIDFCVTVQARTPQSAAPVAVQMTFQDFLKEVDLQFLDHMRRGTSINFADLASDPPPATLQVYPPSGPRNLPTFTSLELGKQAHKNHFRRSTQHDAEPGINEACRCRAMHEMAGMLVIVIGPALASPIVPFLTLSNGSPCHLHDWPATGVGELQAAVPDSAGGE